MTTESHIECKQGSLYTSHHCNGVVTDVAFRALRNEGELKTKIERCRTQESCFQANPSINISFAQTEQLRQCRIVLDIPSERL